MGATCPMNIYAGYETYDTYYKFPKLFYIRTSPAAVDRDAIELVDAVLFLVRPLFLSLLPHMLFR